MNSKTQQGKDRTVHEVSDDEQFPVTVEMSLTRLKTLWPAKMAVKSDGKLNFWISCMT